MPHTKFDAVHFNKLKLPPAQSSFARLNFATVDARHLGVAEPFQRRSEKRRPLPAITGFAPLFGTFESGGRRDAARGSTGAFHLISLGPKASCRHRKHRATATKRRAHHHTDGWPLVGPGADPLPVPGAASSPRSRRVESDGSHTDTPTHTVWREYSLQTHTQTPTVWREGSHRPTRLTAPQLTDRWPSPKKNPLARTRSSRHSSGHDLLPRGRKSP